MWNIEKVVSKGDYNYAVVKEHPNATKHGYVLEHRVIMENHLGRVLNTNEVVHHVNEDKKDNRLENLQLMHVGEHESFHGYKVGRMYVELICPYCGKNFVIPENQSFLKKGAKYTCCSRHCKGKFSRNIQLYGITHEVELAISVNLVRQFRYYHDNTEQTVKQQDA